MSATDGFFHFRDAGIEIVGMAHDHRLRMIEGVASTPTANAHGDSLSSAGCMVKLPVPLLSDHGFFKGRTRASSNNAHMQIGTVFWVRKSAEEILIRATINDSPAGQHAWKLIESGEVRALSAAAKNSTSKMDGVVDGIRYWSTWQLDEVSVCRAGANPDARLWTYTPSESARRA